jgi:hypothetical protein
MQFDVSQKAFFQETMADPMLFMPRVLKIVDKRGQLVNLNPNKQQRQLYEVIKRQREAGRPVRVIILKARQIGFSTFTAGYYYWLSMNPFNRAAIIAHDLDSSKGIFGKMRLFYDMSPAVFRPMRRLSNANELLFDNPDKDSTRRGLHSSIAVKTPENTSLGRGSTFNSLHISELAFWKHAEDAMLAVMQTVPPNEVNTSIIIESTANGIGGVFYERWKQAERGEGDFEPLFFPWYEFEEYSTEPEPGFEPTAEEMEEQAKYNLTLGQLAWRRKMVYDYCGGSIDRFRQEYPATPDEAFIGSGQAVFASRPLDIALAVAPKQVKTYSLLGSDGKSWRGRPIEDRSGKLVIYEMPNGSDLYSLGADIALGVPGGDYSCAEVINVRTGGQVAEWHGHISPQEFGYELYKLGSFYNWAKITPERNSFGISVIDVLRNMHYPNLYRDRTVDRANNPISHRYGFATTKESKGKLISHLAEKLRGDSGWVKGRDTLEELLQYKAEDNGNDNVTMGAPEGKHDDRVMALALAVYGARSMPKENMPSVAGGYNFSAANGW